MMTRLNAMLFGLLAAVFLAGCASQPTTGDSAAAPAAKAMPAMTDAEFAGKLKGNWEGRWEIGNFGGKFVLVVTAVEGTTVKGEAHWYGTATGDTKEPLKTANVKNGVLIGEQPGGTTFKLKLKNADTLDGSWALSGYTGPLNAKRK